MRAKIAAIFLTSSTFVSAASAQQTTGTAYDSADIVVTAQHRSENLQDVPISITALSGAALNQLGMKTSADIAAQVPNLTIKQSFGNSVPTIFLRGVGVNDPNANANGAVGMYVDNVNLVSPSALTFSLFDTDRVEVLRGPQGTLYGRNTTGGAINFLSRQPGDALEGYATLHYGRFKEKEVEAAVTLPLAPGVSTRIAGVFEDNAGFHTNRVTGNRMGDVNRWALRGLLKLQPTSTIDVLLNLHGGRLDNKSTPFEMKGTLDPVTGAPGCDFSVTRCVNLFGYSDDDNDPFSHDIDHEGRTRLWNIGGSGHVDVDLDTMTLTSITAFERTVRHHHEDADGSPQNFLNTYFYDDNRQFSQELRLASKDKQRFRWMLGLFYSHEETKLHNRYDFFRGYRDVVESYGFPGGFDPDGVNPTGLTPFLVDQRLDQKSNSYAGFANLEYDLTDEIELLVGGRYTFEDRAIRTSVAFDEPTGAIPLVDNFSDKVKFRAFSGKLGLNYKPREGILLYASVSRGFKSGGYNGALVFSEPELQPFRPETLYAYEAGFKTSLLDRRLTLNGAAFYYDYQDIQLYTFASANGIPVQVLTNAGAAEIYGVEGEISARPIDRLTINLGGGLLHTKIKNFQTEGGADYSGNHLVLAPSVTGNILVRYDIPLDNDRLKLGLQTDAHYQSRVYFSTSNDSLLAQGGYGLWNARISLAQADDGWEVAAQVRNLTDKRYRSEAFDFSSSSYDLFIYGQPRTWELTATVRF
jgi:iron complex outermembrane receptor protein